MNDFDNTQNEEPRVSSVGAEVKDALAALRQDHFAPGFEDRTLARWTRERAGPSTVTFIERGALQMLPLAIAASLLLAVYSVRLHTTPNVSLIARTFGWNSATTVATNNTASADTYESVYTSLYGLPLVNSASGAR